MVIAASRESSAQYSMPEAAIGRDSAVDQISDVEAIADQLRKLAAGQSLADEPGSLRT